MLAIVWLSNKSRSAYFSFGWYFLFVALFRCVSGEVYDSTSCIVSFDALCHSNIFVNTAGTWLWVLYRVYSVFAVVKSC